MNLNRSAAFCFLAVLSYFASPALAQVKRASLSALHSIPAVKVYRYPTGEASLDTHAQIFDELRKPTSSGAFSSLKVYVVDGAAIRSLIYHEFVYGGNFQRYPWVPTGEIWIDNAISAEEYPYTLAHELYEDELMRVDGLSYAVAHDSALMLEHRMRIIDSGICQRHETSLPKVLTIDADSVRELPLPDSLQLQGIYRVPVGEIEGMNVWVVDGPAVRKSIYPDFGFSGNDMVYYFIPKGELWIDNSISCEETLFSIATELEERRLMKAGIGYDTAYTAGIARSGALRTKLAKESAARPSIIVSKMTDRETVSGTHRVPIVIPH